jgi:2-keto-4-pentenoate hydratase/2-oxohepta-3-ene-1,7-dioic acid hydratase in catechol pathway
MPVPLDPTMHIFNVHWEGGLAVIFGETDEDAPVQEAAKSVKEMEEA